jgi:plasmid stability protein
MKTTLELPDELARRIKIRAAERNQKLKDTVAQLLELGLANLPEDKAPARVPKPIRIKRQGLLTIDDIESAIAAGRD